MTDKVNEKEDRRIKEVSLASGVPCLCESNNCPRCSVEFDIHKYGWSNDDVKMTYIIADTWLAIEPKDNHPLDINQRDSIAIARYFYSQIQTDNGKRVFLNLISQGK